MPAELEKSDDGEWKIRGLASTEARDQQGEIILQKGMDLTPIDKKQGYFNFDHLPGPQNLVGVIDGYNKTDKGLYVSGRLFKNHTKAKAIHEIMTSLGKSDVGRCGLSVEGKILKRNAKDPKIIEKCQIKNVAITFAPVNGDTACELIKSLTSSDIEFAANEDGNSEEGSVLEPTFTTKQVISLIEKALGVGTAGATAIPAERTGGDALAQEDLDKKPKNVQKEEAPKHKKLKRLSKEMYKSHMSEILDKIQTLYPNNTKDELWAAVKDRLYRKFPELSEKDL